MDFSEPGRRVYAPTEPATAKATAEFSRVTISPNGHRSCHFADVRDTDRPALPFVKRIAKGLIHFHYSAYGHIDADYDVQHILATNTIAQEAMNELGASMTYGERGGRVFRFWHGFTTDNPDKGALILKFYDGVTFLVRFGHGLEELRP